MCDTTGVSREQGERERENKKRRGSEKNLRKEIAFPTTINE